MIKKIVAFIPLFALCMSLYAQNIKISPDFTGTDIHGVEHNLFTYLDQGKHVFIHTTGSF